MADIKDYKCNYENSAGINSEITKNLGLIFPDAHFNCDCIVKLAKALKEHDGAAFCELPFCHTLEAEALGGIINYGDENVGPRAKDYAYTSLDELLELPETDLKKGRISEMLSAAEELVKNGEYVVYEVCGPVTVLSMLIDMKHLFKGFRKQPETIKEILNKIGDRLIVYMEEIFSRGVQAISFADVTAGVNILGPKMAEQLVDMFTYDFVKKIEKLTNDKNIIVFCPKTSFALLGTDKAEFRDVPLPCPMTYQEAVKEMTGKVNFAGTVCIKNSKLRLENGVFKELVIK